MRGQRVVGLGAAVILILVLVGRTTAAVPSGSLPAAPTAAPSSPAALVTRLVELALAGRVLVLERAAVAANEHVLAYCVDPGRLAIECSDLPLRPHGESTATLISGLAEPLRTFSAASDELWQLSTPVLDGPAAVHLGCVIEDLTLFSDQFARLLRETATAIPGTTKAPTANTTYGARERTIVPLLDRAEAWLETLDHETGARARLPGFEPGNALHEEFQLR